MKPPNKRHFRARPSMRTLPAPETFDWRAVSWRGGSPCRWMLDEDTELGVLPAERDHAYLRSVGRTQIWYDTSPEEVALQIELGFLLEPDEVLNSGRGRRPALRLLPGDPD